MSTANIGIYSNLTNTIRKTYFSCTGSRFPGGGFISGSSADYPIAPLTVSSPVKCAELCASRSDCRQYVYGSSGISTGVCYVSSNAYNFNPGDTSQYPLGPAFTSGYVINNNDSWFVSAGWQGSNFSMTVTPPNPTTAYDVRVVNSLSNVEVVPWTSGSGVNPSTFTISTLSSTIPYKVFFRMWATGSGPSSHVYLDAPLIVPAAPTSITSDWILNSSGEVDLKVTWTNPNLTSTANTAERDSYPVRMRVVNATTNATLSENVITNMENTNISTSKYSTTLTGLNKDVVYNISMNITYVTPGIGNVTSQYTTYNVPAFSVPEPSNISNTWESGGCTFSCSNSIANACSITIKRDDNTTLLAETPMISTTLANNGGSTFTYTYANLSPTESYSVSFKASKIIGINSYNSSIVSFNISPPSNLVSSWKGANNSTPTPSTVLTNLLIGWTKTSGVSSIVKILDGNGQPITGQPEKDIAASSSTATFSNLTATNNYRYSVSTYTTTPKGTISSAPITRSLAYITPSSSPVPTITSSGNGSIIITYNNLKLDGAGTAISGSPFIVQSSAACGQLCKDTETCVQHVAENDSYCNLYPQSSTINTSNTANWNPTDQGSISNMFKSGYVTTLNPPTGLSITSGSFSMTASWTPPSSLTSLLNANAINYSISFGPVRDTSASTINFVSTPLEVVTQSSFYFFDSSKFFDSNGQLTYGTTYGVVIKTFVLDKDNNRVYSTASTLPQYYTTEPLPAPMIPSISAMSSDLSVDLTFYSPIQTPQTTYTLYYGISPIDLTVSSASRQSIPNIPITTRNYTVSGLANGSTYNFRLEAINSTASSLSNTISVTPEAASVPPSGSVTISTPTVGSQQVTLSWSRVAGASSYMVYYDTVSSVRKTLASSRSVSPTGVIGNTYQVTGLTNETTYYFAVYPRNSAGIGDSRSNVVSARPVLGPPSQPTNLTATSRDNAGTLAWDSVPTASSYEVFLSTSIPFADSNKIGTTTNCSYIFENLTNGTHYYVGVKSVNNLGLKSEITVASDINPTANVPTTPGGLSISTSVSTFMATWNTVTGAASYNFYYSTSSDMRTNLVRVNSENGNFNGTGTPSLKYWGQVTAVNSLGQESNPSSIIPFVMKDAPVPVPGPVTDLKVVAGGNMAVAYWTAVKYAESYIVYYTTDKNFVKNVESVNSINSRVAIYNLFGDTVYYFNVVAVNGTGTSDLSDVVSSPIQKKVSPPEPSVLDKVKTFVKSNKMFLAVLSILIIGFIFYFTKRPQTPPVV